MRVSAPNLFSTRTEIVCRISKERIMGLLFGYGGQRTVSGADQSFGRQSENLLPHLLPRQIPGLVSASHRTGEDRISNDGDVRGILGPGADDIGEAVLGMTGRIAVGDAQAAQVNEIVRAVALV